MELAYEFLVDLGSSEWTDGPNLMTYYKTYILHNYHAQFFKYPVLEEQLLSHGCAMETSATATKAILKTYWCLSVMPVSFPHLKGKRATVSLTALSNKNT